MNDKGLISLSLLRSDVYKAAGQYTIIRDETSSPIQPINPIVCLVPGVSKVGIFNAPVYIEKGDISTFTQIFGESDKVLERKGSYFHEIAKTALQEGPIIALNLLNLNNEIDNNGNPTINSDIVDYKSFSVDIASYNGTNQNRLYSSFFNKERFWKADSEYLLATRKIQDKKSILNLVNLSKSPISFIIRKSNVRGFDITVKDWYGDQEIPKYLKETDYISDYFIDIIAIRGDFGPEQYSRLSADVIFGQFFNNSGLIISKLNDFLNLNEVSIIDIFTGCLITNFIDKDGTPLFIEKIINDQNLKYGILCAVDNEELDSFETGENTKKLDLVGHSLVDYSVTDTDFLSYKKRLVQDFPYSEKTSNQSYKLNHNYGFTKTDYPGKIVVSITPQNPDFYLLNDLLTNKMLFEGQRTSAGNSAGITIQYPVLEITKLFKTPTQITFELRSPFKDLETLTSGSFVDLKTTATSNYTALPHSFSISDEIEVIINDNSTPIVLATYTWGIGSTISSMLAQLSSQINSNSNSTKVTSVNNSPTFSLKYNGNSEGPISFIVAVNADSSGPSYDITSVENEGLTFFTNGVTLASSKFETENNRIIIDGTTSFYLTDVRSQIYSDWKNGEITSGDKVKSNSDEYYVKFEEIKAENGVDLVDDYRNLLKISLYSDSDLTISVSSGNAILFGSFLDSNGYDAGANKLNIISLSSSINLRVPAIVINDKTVQVDISYEKDIKIGHYLVGKDSEDNDILARIESIKRIGGLTPTHIEITTNIKIKQFTNVDLEIEVERFLPIKDIYDTYNFTCLKGFTLKQNHLPNGTNQRIREIYNVMTSTNIANSLADPEMISFRYLLDTFNGGLEPFSKDYLSKLLKRRRKSFGLLNAPRIKEFKDSINPRFTNTPTPIDPTPILNTRFIAQGGNLDENPDFLYSLPDESDGASYVAFFSPNIENRLPSGEIMLVPPSGKVSNNYVKKWSDNPFKPASGGIRGILSGGGISGLEYYFTKEERGDLETFGINPIYRKSNGDYVIMGNETSYKKFRSILNNINIRDTLITIETDTENIVSGFEFDYSDDTNRVTIISALKKYYGDLRDVFGAISEFTIKFDRQNNPDWVTAEGASVIDIRLSFPDISKRYFNRITLFRNSRPAVGSFVAV